MKINLNEKLSKLNSFVDNPNAKETRIFYYIITAVFILGFVFFLTSKMWIPEKGGLFTPLGTKMELTPYASLTLKRWDYDKENKLMEVELKKSNDYVTTDYSYLLSASTVKGKQIQVNVNYDCEDFMVLQLVNVPNTNQVNLGITLKVKESEEKTNVYSQAFYCDVKTVAGTKLSTQIKSQNEYLIDSVNSDIKLCEIAIADYENEVTKINEQITAYNDKIKSLEENMKFQNKEDSASSQVKIDSFNNNITLSNTQIEDIEESIIIKQEEIEFLKQRIREIG